MIGQNRQLSGVSTRLKRVYVNVDFGPGTPAEGLPGDPDPDEVIRRMREAVARLRAQLIDEANRQVAAKLAASGPVSQPPVPDAEHCPDDEDNRP